MYPNLNCEKVDCDYIYTSLFAKRVLLVTHEEKNKLALQKTDVVVIPAV